MNKIQFKDGIPGENGYIVKNGEKYTVQDREVRFDDYSFGDHYVADASSLNEIQNIAEEQINYVNNDLNKYYKTETVTLLDTVTIKNGYYDENENKYFDLSCKTYIMNADSGGETVYGSLTDFENVVSIEGQVIQPNGNVTDLNYWVSNTDYSCVFIRYVDNTYIKSRQIIWRKGSSYGFGKAIIKIKEKVITN